MQLDTGLAFAGERTRGVVITLRQNGRPQASNILYALIDGVVRVSVTGDRAKTANARRDERVSLHVTSEDFWQWVVIDGRAELTPEAREPGDATCQELRAYYEAASGPHPDWDEYDRAMVEEGRLVLRIHPERAYGQVSG